MHIAAQIVAPKPIIGNLAQLLQGLSYIPAEVYYAGALYYYLS